MIEKLINAIKTGESVNIEFKSCTNKISSSVYDTICSFSNRSGGLIILGVDDDMNLVGINRNQILDLKKNIINSLCNFEQYNLNLPDDITRYSDRRTLRCNIIMSYIKMLDFLMKYLPDKFYLPSDGTTSRIDLRVQIFREVIGNICAHSDYQPGFGGYLEIFYDRVITRNATRLIPTIREGLLTLDELGPYTKNPLIVRVLNELHFVEDLGSGRRNIKTYAPLYYSESKIEITNSTQFEFSITYDKVSNNVKTGKVAGKVTGKVVGKSNNDKENNIIKLIVVIGLETLSVKEIMERLNLKGADNFRKTYLYPALKGGYIIMTEKDRLSSPKQKYFLSKKGKTLL